jgi:hypothetical protein
MKLPVQTKLKQTKLPFFKNGEQEDETGPVWGLVPVVREDIRKGCGRANVVETLYIHTWKRKNETCWHYSRNEGKGIKENDGRGEFSYYIL